MKNLKILVLILCAVSLTACSDDEGTVNSSPASVSLQETTMTVKETAGLYNVPLVITGERNGDIRIIVDVEDHSAVADQNYVLTTKELLIPAAEKTAHLEFRTIDDEDRNEDRTFDIVIKEVIGAEIGTNSRLAITIKDNDSSYYESLAGTWIFTGTASSNTVTGGVNTSFSVKVTTADEGTEAYEKYIVCSSNNGFDPDNDIPWEFEWRMEYQYDAASNKITLSIVSGEDVAANGLYTIRFRRQAIDGSSSKVYRGEYDTESKTVIFENANLVGDLYHDGLVYTQKFRLFDCKMVRL